MREAGRGSRDEDLLKNGRYADEITPEMLKQRDAATVCSAEG